MKKILFAVVLYVAAMCGLCWLMLAGISTNTPPTEQTTAHYTVGIFEPITQTYTTPPNYTNYQTGQTFTDTNGYRDDFPVWGEYVVLNGATLNDALFALRYFPEYANGFIFDRFMAFTQF